MKSLDVGTMFLVKGEEDELVDNINFTVARNVFLQASTTEDTEDTLRENNWSYVKHLDNYYILGEDAIKLKNLLTVNVKKGGDDIVMTKVGELRRPMRRGILNTSEEKLSIAIIQNLIQNLMGPPSHPGEVLCFCVPGDPVDSNLSVLFHQSMLSSFLKSLGYTVEHIPEALAIIFSEMPSVDGEDGEEPFSGISFSFGAGMCNICLKGDTKIPLLNGDTPTIAELSRSHKDKNFWVYSCQKDGQIVAGKAHSPRITKMNAELVKVYLDDSSCFECTPDHLILSRGGEYIEAQNLKTGDSLMPLSNQHNHKVIKVEKSGKSDVYDLTVDDYHNFAIDAGVFVHNCFAYKKMPLIAFSVAQCGDWIDIEASKVAGVDVSAMTRYKEAKFNLNNVDYSNMKDAALDIFYNNMIEHALDKFSEKFSQLDVEDQIHAPLEIVIAGGTSMIPGFIDKFNAVLGSKELTFRVKNVRHAEEPLYAVSSGCLMKAISTEKKIKEKESKAPKVTKTE